MHAASVVAEETCDPSKPTLPYTLCWRSGKKRHSVRTRTAGRHLVTAVLNQGSQTQSHCGPHQHLLSSKGPVVSVRLDVQRIPSPYIACQEPSHHQKLSPPLSLTSHCTPPFLMLLLGRSWMHCLKAESKGLEEDQRRAGALL